MSRLFKNAWFQRFAKREKIADKALKDAIKRAEKGVIDADLGGGLIKQRIVRASQEAIVASLYIKRAKRLSLYMVLPRMKKKIWIAKK